jgi:hypothetical protein
MTNYLWHTTTAENAGLIQLHGFKDAKAVRRQLSHTFDYGSSGTWVSTMPALDDDLFDGFGAFDFDAMKQAFIRITVPSGHNLQGEHWVDESWRAGQQYLCAAEDLNKLECAQVSLGEVVRYRITNDPSISLKDLERWLGERLAEGYGAEFALLVQSTLSQVQSIAGKRKLSSLIRSEFAS